MEKGMRRHMILPCCCRHCLYYNARQMNVATREYIHYGL